MINKFETNNFTEFMYTLSDFEISAHIWADENASCTWDMKVEIGKNKFIIYLNIDENKNKYKGK
jgi:hypothetical protein